MKRKIPDFIVAGVARAGTTWLHHILSQHESIYLPHIKELNYFSHVESKNKEDYKSPSPNVNYHTKIINDWSTYTKLYKNASPNQLTGDISPSYMFDSDVARRLKEKNSNAKIIISLRSPVERAISHYKMNYYTGFEKNPNLKEALESKYDGFWGGGNCYLKCSFYYENLKSFFDVFSHENILVLIYEEWIEDQKKIIKKITDFLEINEMHYHNLDLNYQNKIKSIKYLRLLNFFRNQKIKNGLKKIIPQNKIDFLKRRYFEDDYSEVSITLENEKKLMALFEEDVQKTSKLLDKDLLSLWGYK